MRREQRKATISGLIWTAILAVLIFAGSRNLRHVDAALVAYTFACLFAVFGIAYRHSMWLQRPPTGLYWRRGRILADKAVTPIYATCCAFAGDRGFLHPELTRSATQEQVAELGQEQCDRYVCSNRTCEIGMNLATGKDYRSVIFLLEELTRT
jgi:hypothetical protein